jgi:hypothetical protein
MITDANLCNQDIHSQIEESAKHLEHAKDQFSESFPTDAEIVLALPPLNKLNARCCYYCVSHESQTLFWLNKVDISPMLVEVKGLSYLSQASEISIKCIIINAKQKLRGTAGISILVGHLNLL